MAARSSDNTDGTVAHVIDLLSDWGHVQPQRMFRSHGLFRDGVMFGLINRDTLYLKTGDANIGDYESRDLAPFRYSRGTKRVALGYHAAPAEALDDAETLAEWAEKAYAVAMIRAAASRRKPAKRAAKKSSKRTVRGSADRS